MSLMEKMMGIMSGRMSKDEKAQMMDKMMGKFFEDVPPEDKQKMMEEMMPKMMEGVNMMEMMPKMMMRMMGGVEGMGGLMPGMMGKNADIGMPIMPQMMMEMMPQCLTVMLPKIPVDKRIDFVMKMVQTLLERGVVDMSEEERDSFVEKVMDAATPGRETNHDEHPENKD